MCWFLVCLVVLHFFKGVVNIAGGKNLTKFQCNFHFPCIN